MNPLTIHELDALQGSPRTWGWILLSDLAISLNMKPIEIISRYGFLSKDYGQYGVLTVSNGAEVFNPTIAKIIEALTDLGEEEAAKVCFVPAGWAKDVIESIARKIGYENAIEASNILSLWPKLSGEMKMKVMPAIYKFHFIDWGWVQLRELCQILNLKSKELLDRYGALSKDAPQHGVLAVTRGDKIQNLPIEQIYLMDNESRHLYVPAGWATAVLKAHSQGYTRVELEEMYLDEDDEDQPEWLEITHKTGFDNRFWVAVGHKE